MIAAGILGWLLYQNQDPIRGLLVREKNVYLLLASLASMLTATCLSFTRWFLLVRALDIRFSLREAYRYGFIGYLFNFVGPSAVGGDLFKGFMLAREQTERRAEAVATILIDRIVGFYSLMVMASAAIMLSDAIRLQELGHFLQLVVWTTIAVTLGGIVLLLPGRYTNWVTQRLTKLPFVGGIATRVIAALELYRQRRLQLVFIVGLSLISHVCIALTVRFADQAVHPATPSFYEHLIISPLSSVAAAAPLPGGMGTFELAMDFLFQRLPKVGMETGQGLSVAVIYRLVTVCVAMVGVVYYFANKSAVSRTIPLEAMDVVE